MNTKSNGLVGKLKKAAIALGAGAIIATSPYVPGINSDVYAQGKSSRLEQGIQRPFVKETERYYEFTFPLSKELREFLRTKEDSIFFVKLPYECNGKNELNSAVGRIDGKYLIMIPKECVNDNKVEFTTGIIGNYGGSKEKPISSFYYIGVIGKDLGSKIEQVGLEKKMEKNDLEREIEPVNINPEVKELQKPAVENKDEKRFNLSFSTVYRTDGTIWGRLGTEITLPNGKYIIEPFLGVNLNGRDHNETDTKITNREREFICPKTYELKKDSITDIFQGKDILEFGVRGKRNLKDILRVANIDGYLGFSGIYNKGKGTKIGTSEICIEENGEIKDCKTIYNMISGNLHRRVAPSIEAGVTMPLLHQTPFIFGTDISLDGEAGAKYIFGNRKDNLVGEGAIKANVRF